MEGPTRTVALLYVIVFIDMCCASLSYVLVPLRIRALGGTVQVRCSAHDASSS